MKRLLIVLLIALISVGCSNKNSQQSSQATPESSQTSEKNLTIEMLRDIGNANQMKKAYY